MGYGVSGCLPLGETDWQTDRQRHSAFCVVGGQRSKEASEAGGTRLLRFFRIDDRVNFQTVGARFEICFDAMRSEM